MQDAPLLLGGAISVLAAAVHGGAGEMLVVSRLRPEALPSTVFGGSGLSKTMIRVSWHIATAALLIVGVALVLAGTALDPAAARPVARLAAVEATAIAAIALAFGFYAAPLRTIYRHPGPILLTSVAVLAWWGAL